MTLFLIILGFIVGYYLGGLLFTHLTRILAIAVILGVATSSAAYDGYWYQPRAYQHHHVSPPCYNPYQFHSPYTYFNPYIELRPSGRVRTPNSSFYYRGW
jgi:hypothetical protein